MIQWMMSKTFPAQETRWFRGESGDNTCVTGGTKQYIAIVGERLYVAIFKTKLICRKPVTAF